MIMNKLILILFLILALGFQERSDFKAARVKMVDSQIIERGIQDRSTLAAMRTVPRHKFVPEDLKARAYFGNLPLLKRSKLPWRLKPRPRLPQPKHPRRRLPPFPPLPRRHPPLHCGLRRQHLFVLLRRQDAL